MNAETFNALYEVGIPVFAYPGCRPEDAPSDERLITRTRSKATVLAGHTDVVWVDGHSACIALSHVDPVTEDEWEKARAEQETTTVARRAALLAAIQADPLREWKPGLAIGVLRRAGFHPISHRTASGDLQALAAAGHLTPHEVTVVSWYGPAGGAS